MREGEGLDEGGRNRKQRSGDRQGTERKEFLPILINSGSKRKEEKMKTPRFQ